jgi:DHA3 family macrolide efflux protein-like MFS transporter
MSTFVIIWIGQFISMLGTGMTNLGLPIWVYGQTGRATDLTTIGGLFVAAWAIASPFSGVLIDRSNRKLMMIVSDLAAGLVTVRIFILYSLGRLQIWHLYVSAVVQGAFQTFQWPALASVISVMVPKAQYTRTATLLELAGSGSWILAPAIAGALLCFLGNARGLQVILLVDIVTFLVAVGTLLVVDIPQPEASHAQKEAAGGPFLQELLFGFRYILARPGLLGLQGVYILGNFFFILAAVLIDPMILARTGSSTAVFSTATSLGAAGAVVGGVVVSAWGGFRQRVRGVLIGWVAVGLFIALIGLGRAEPAWAALPVWGAGLFLGSSVIPLIDGSNQAIWQSKVPPDVQGKVFSIRGLIARTLEPLAAFIAGPLADRALEPAMGPGGGLAGRLGWLVGRGHGAGMSLAILFGGLMVSLVGLGGFFVPAIRGVEDTLPDHGLDAGGRATVRETPGLERNDWVDA